ncbi:MAG: DHA2 family efflux MFS transporter permease subunit [Anaerolineae bacterium]
MKNNNATAEQNPLRWMVLLTVIIGTFLGRLDSTVVNLALPKIINDFSISVSQAGWIATAYILANAIFVPIWGKLGDSIGRRRIYVLGFTIFIFGSVLTGLAWNLSSMLVFRVIQAIAASADYPTAMAIIAVTFPNGKARAQALGLWSSSFMVAIVFGPLIGGPLIDHFGWRSVFLVNLPVGIIGLVMALVFIRESVSERKVMHFDFAGSITLGISLSALVLVLDQGTDWGWFSVWSIACYLTMIVFGYIFYRIDIKHPEPIVDFKFFKIPAFNAALANNFITFMGMSGGVFLIPVFVQTFLGFSATQTGYLFMPMAFFMMLASPLGVTLVGKVQPKYVIAASTLVGGLGLLLYTQVDARSTALDIMIPMSVMAFGLGFGMSQRTSIIAAVIPTEEIGIASSILALVRNISGAFGISVFATILSNGTENNLIAISRYSIVNTVNPLIRAVAGVLMTLKAEIDAYRIVFAVAAGVMALASVVVIFTLNIREMKSGVEILID